MKDLTKTKYLKIAPNIKHDKIQGYIDRDEPINGFIGWVEISTSTLETRVPSYFDNHKTEDGEERTFFDYVGGVVHDSINVGKVLIPIGERDNLGNGLKDVTWEEFKSWFRKFGIDKIKTKSQGEELIKRNEKTED